MIGHTGDLGSFTSAYWGFPETESAIVVLTNSSSSDGDPSNIVTQVLMQALFDLKPVIDFVKVASEVVAEAREGWNRAVDAWTANRLSGTQSRELKAYTGIYTSTDFCMTLKVSALSEHDPRPLRLYINDLLIRHSTSIIITTIAGLSFRNPGISARNLGWGTTSTIGELFFRFCSVC